MSGTVTDAGSSGHLCTPHSSELTHKVYGAIIRTNYLRSSLEIQRFHLSFAFDPGQSFEDIRARAEQHVGRSENLLGHAAAWVCSTVSIPCCQILYIPREMVSDHEVNGCLPERLGALHFLEYLVSPQPRGEDRAGSSPMFQARLRVCHNPPYARGEFYGGYVLQPTGHPGNWGPHRVEQALASGFTDASELIRKFLPLWHKKLTREVHA